MYGFPLAIYCYVKISNSSSKFIKYTDVLREAVTLLLCIIIWCRYQLSEDANQRNGV